MITADAAITETGDTTDPARNPLMSVGNPDPDEAPYMRCTRCGTAWLVIEDGAVDYDAAETAAIGRLKATDPLAKKLVARRDRRAEKQKPDKPARTT